MTNDKFAALVHKLEREAERNPARYQRKVLALAVLGNAYLGMIVLLLVVLTVASVGSLTVLKALGIKLLVLVVPFLWLMLRAMRVKLEVPAGFEVSAAEAPELFAVIEDLQRRLRSVRLHRVLITDEFNACIVQLPRLGILGWPRNYLLLGLPLLQTLTVEQFTAVLAHEMGHLSRGHGQVANWIYRQRMRWRQLLEALERRGGGGAFLFKPFLNFYGPYFQACSFPLARANEYEADAASARLTSPRAAAEALTSVNVVGAYLVQRYWPEIHKQADVQAQPAFAPFHEFSQSIAGALDLDSAQAWLDQALGRDTDLADTHPALRDRLRAIGEPARLALPAAGLGADRLLGTALPRITAQCDERWRSRIASAWEARYRTVQEGRQQLAELDARLGNDEVLTIDELCNRARLMVDFGRDPESALAQLRELQQRAPDHAGVVYLLGKQLLERDDAAGCALLDQAMAGDDDAIAPAAKLLRDFHWRAGRKEEAQRWHERMVEQLRVLEAAEQERNTLRLNDALEPHGLGDEAITSLCASVRRVPGLTGAFFARKVVANLAHRPLYLLGFTVTKPMRRYHKERALAAVQDLQREVQFPGETLILNLEGENAQFLKRFRKVTGAKLF